MKLRITLTLAVAAVVISALPTAAGALNRPPNGRYVCTVQENPYIPPMETGRVIRVNDRNSYSFFNGRKWREGAYRYIAARDVVRFRTGTLQGRTAKHGISYAGRRHRLTLVIARPSGPVTHVCERA